MASNGFFVYLDSVSKEAESEKKSFWSVLGKDVLKKLVILVALIAVGMFFVTIVKVFRKTEIKVNVTSGGMKVISYVILAFSWFIAAGLAWGIVYANYKNAGDALAPINRHDRHYRMVRLMLTIPFYMTVNHLIFMAFVHNMFLDDVWGLQEVFSESTILEPGYVWFCISTLIGSVVSGAISIASTIKLDWDSARFGVISGFFVLGWVLTALGFILFKTTNVKHLILTFMKSWSRLMSMSWS